MSNKVEEEIYGDGCQKTGKRNVHIIYDKNSGKIARVMRTIIGLKYDLNCDIFKYVEYFEKCNMKSDDVMIFLGDIENIREVRKLVKTEKSSDAWGWHYGWVGKLAFVWSEYALQNKQDKKKFFTDYRIELKDLIKKVRTSQNNKTDFKFDVLIFIAFGLFSSYIKKKLVSLELSRKKVKMGFKQDIFKFAVMKFINNDLDSFLDNLEK